MADRAEIQRLLNSGVYEGVWIQATDQIMLVLQFTEFKGFYSLQGAAVTGYRWKIALPFWKAGGMS